MSRDDLVPVYKLFHLKLKKSNHELFMDINLITILIECLYKNEQLGQLELCQKLVTEIANETTTSEQITHSNAPNQRKKILINQVESDQIKTLQTHLKACDIFKKYGCKKTLSYIQNSCQTVESCRDSLVCNRIFNNEF